MAKGEIRIEYVSLDALIRWPRNPKLHDLDGIGGSMQRWGYTQPILIDETTGQMVAGHGRLETLQRMQEAGEAPPARVTRENGTWYVPILRGVGFESEAEAEAYLLADNRLVELGGWDEGMLVDVLGDLEGAEIPIIGWDEAELNRLLRSAEVAQAEADEARQTLAERFGVPPFSVLDARQGYWQRRKRAWIALGIQSELGRGTDLLKDGSSSANLPGAVAWQQANPPAGKGKGMSEQLAPRKKRKAAPGGAMFPADKVGPDGKFGRADLHAGVRKNHGLLSKSTERPGYGLDYDLSNGESAWGGSGTSIFDPVLAELAYRWFCPPGGRILDPFAGGSVRGVVAAKLGREYVGIDLRPEQIEANRAQWGVIKQRPIAFSEAGSQVADYMPDQTPVQEVDGYLLKRDDLYAVAGVRGGKVRTCWHLSQGAEGLVTAGSRASPQVNIVAHIARRLGVPCRVHVPSGELSPELLAARATGAEVIQHKPGYNTVIVKRAKEDAEARGWVEIPFGMECEAAIGQTRGQVASLVPYADRISRIVISVGSGMSLAGLLHGLLDHGLEIPVVGVCVGADPTKRLNQYAPERWGLMATLVESGTDYHQPYGGDPRLGEVVLDAHYEAKAIPHLEAGDLFWCVGIRQTAGQPVVDQPDPEWLVGDSRGLGKLVKDQVDLIFTCPPYGDLEVYSDDERDLSQLDYPAFRADYAKIIKAAVRKLRKHRFAAVVVGDFRDPKGFYRNFVSHTIEAFEAAGAHLYNEAILVTVAGSLPVRAGRYFTTARKLGKTHQNVLVFCKGDPKLATQAVGTPEFGDLNV